jgi:ketosteroid isomerase-like protein
MRAVEAVGIREADLSALATKLFDAFASRDVDSFVACLADDVALSFGNVGPVDGPAAARSTLEQIYRVVQKITHEVRREWIIGRDLLVDAMVTYDRHDGKSITVPCISVITTNDDGLISTYRIFIDASPVFAE